LSVEVDGQNGFSAGCNFFGNALRVKVQGALIDVGEDYFGAEDGGGIGSGDPTQRGGDDFVAESDFCRDHGQVQAGSAGGDGEAECCAAIFCKGFFKLLDFGATGRRAGAQHFENGGLFFRAVAGAVAELQFVDCARQCYTKHLSITSFVDPRSICKMLRIFSVRRK
jgi:hypothetical protein